VSLFAFIFTQSIKPSIAAIMRSEQALALQAMLMLAAVVLGASPAPARAAAHAPLTPPVIGVYADDNTSDNLQFYIDWVTAAGGEALLLPNASKLPAAMLLDRLDGLLIPGAMVTKPNNDNSGGGVVTGGPPVETLARRLLERAVELNKKRHFPVWGTCLGMEWMLEFLGGGRGVVERHYVGDASRLTRLP
jgi:gamma-glutamyl hydrolase